MPEAPAAPPPVSTPSGAPAPPTAPSTNLNNAFAELDSFFGSGDGAVESSPATPSPEKPAPEKPATPPAKPEAPKEAPKPPEQKPPENQRPPKAKTLAEAKEQAIERAKNFEAQANQWKAKYEALEKQNATPKDDGQRKILEERLETATKRLQDIENELKYSNYERSPEYEEKWNKPFISAYNLGRAKVASIKVRDGRQTAPDGSVVEEGTWRQGTHDDFDALMGIKDEDAAADFAERVFGNKASTVLYYRQRTEELNQHRINAIDDYRKNGSEREKLMRETHEKTSKEINDTWQSENQKAAEKYPQWFKPAEGDEKGNQLLERGFQVAAMAFNSNGKMNPVEMAKVHSAVFNKAAGFDRLAYRAMNTEKQLKEALEKLKQYEDSEPNGGTERRERTERPADDLESVIGELDKYVTK